MWIDSRDRTGERQGRRREMAQAKKVAFYIIVIFVLYTIINTPARAADLVQEGFEGISEAAHQIGEFMTELVE
ncbi:hypothetical protein RKE29_07390 [Streptomyces sp. B1866]|uniref:hypothetical protein n=1 Tax=Streptomyces sp. B1866 TaxID=3075431 RepID=UPI00288F5C0B|nr:hypothetical protein [Streptomyces sp. B1866]MDT3396465.1 hypothetical protein [Streptomyces sp. B1866]